MKGTGAPLLAGAGVGFVVAALAALVSLRAGGAWALIVQIQMIGIAYLVAGAIAWRRRPDNATGPLLVAIGYSWYIPEFQALAVPFVAGLAFATRRVVNALSAYLMLAFPSGRLGLRRHRIAMGLVVAINAIQIPAGLLLVDRVPAVLGHLGPMAIVGCDCANPFAVADAPVLFATIETWTGFLSAAAAVIILGLVTVRLAAATAPMRRVVWPVLFGALVGLALFAFAVLSDVLSDSSWDSFA